MTASCGWEGPRGGECHNDATCRVNSGEYDSTKSHFSSYSCPRHVNDLRAECVRVTGVDALVDPMPGRVQQETLL